MNKQQIKDRVQKTKSYVIDHAPQIVTAVASVTALTLIRKNNHETHDVRELLRSENNQRAYQAQVIDQCIDEGRTFDFYPGVGIHIHAADSTQQSA